MHLVVVFMPVFAVSAVVRRGVHVTQTPAIRALSTPVAFQRVLHPLCSLFGHHHRTAPVFLVPGPPYSTMASLGLLRQLTSTAVRRQIARPATAFRRFHPLASVMGAGMQGDISNNLVPMVIEQTVSLSVIG